MNQIAFGNFILFELLKNILLIHAKSICFMALHQPQDIWRPVSLETRASWKSDIFRASHLIVQILCNISIGVYFWYLFIFLSDLKGSQEKIKLISIILILSVIYLNRSSILPLIKYHIYYLYLLMQSRVLAITRFKKEILQSF